MNIGTVRALAQQIAGASALGAFIAIAGCGSSPKPPASTQLAVSASAATVTFGSAVTLTATLGGGSAASGVITFYDGTTELQPVIVSGTTVTATVTSLSPGAHSLTAQYTGDGSNSASTSSGVSVNVTVPTVVTVAASPTFAMTGAPVTLTATLTSPSYTGTPPTPPTGTVTFFYGTVNLGTGTVDSKGVATATTMALPFGYDQVTASFSPSGFYLASASSAATVEVHGQLLATSITVSATPTGTVPAGVVETISAAVVPASTTVPLTGNINFYDGTTLLGTGAISAGNTATITTRSLQAGPNNVTAVYTGDIIYATSTSNQYAITVNAATGATYTNPLNVSDPTTGKVFNCPDPAIIKTQTGGANTWYAYCTGDAFNSTDLVPHTTNFRAHLISIFSSADLINWTYVNDALTALPSWIHSTDELQTPAVKFFNGLYHLYYEIPDVTTGVGDSAIGVATASTPTGPFTDSGSALIPSAFLFTNGPHVTNFAPEVITDAGNQNWLTLGGVYGGINIRKLSADGLSVDNTTTVNIATDNYYQDPFLFFHGGFYYLFVTAGGCCGGPYSTDNVHVGRSATITGPYLDAEGYDLNAYSNPATAGSVGGDPVLVMNGNDIVGAGSNSIFTDEAGQDYILYSGVSKMQPYLPNATGYTARQLMMDALDWVNGWPVARNGNGPSDFKTAQAVPAAQPGGTNQYIPPPFIPDAPGTLIAASSDDFNESTLNLTQWSFLHAVPSYRMTGTAYSVDSINAESANSSVTSLPILVEPEPTGNYLLEIKLNSTVTEGRGNYIFNNSSSGVFIYNTDLVNLRLDEFPDFEVRQIEFLNQLAPFPNFVGGFAPVGTPSFGLTTPNNNFTYLRLAKRAGVNGAPDTYTSYSSTDGVTFLKGPAWTVSYGAGAKIGLYAGNTVGYTASFDYIHVSTLTP